MYRGYIKLWRKLQDNDLWKKEKFTRGQAWVDLIMLANHKDGHIRKRGIRVELKRGDIGWSERELSKRWKWSRDKTRRFLNELCSEHESKLIPQTEPQNKNITSCYSIVNYETYQGDNTTDCTTNRPQTGHKQYQNKNDKNEKNNYSVDFLKFYSAYPRKIAKTAAYKKWVSLNNKLPPLDNILLAIEKQKEWRRNANGEFRPDWKHPATWLNQGCWEDECETKPKMRIVYD